MGRKVKIFSALEVANICGVVNQTAINWIKNGYLKAFTTPGGQYRIYAKDLASFLDKRGMADSNEALQIMMDKAKWNTVLIASDDEALAARLRDELADQLPEYEVLMALDGFETGRKLIEEKPGYVIVDGSLTGVDIGRFVRTVKFDVAFGKPFVFVMGFNGAIDQLPERPDGSFSKPPDLIRLVETIRDLEKKIEFSMSA